MDYTIELATSGKVKARLPEEQLRARLTEVLEFTSDEESPLLPAFKAGDPYRTTQEDDNLEWVVRYLKEPNVVLACVADIGEVDAIVNGQASEPGISVNVSVSNSVLDILSEDKIDQIVRSALARIEQGQPELDGKESVAARHDFKTDDGEFSTFTVYVRVSDQSPMSVHVGKPHEITMVQDDFQDMADNSNVRWKINRSPKDKARRRAARRRQDKVKQKAGGQTA